jgi:hypothetical protein
MNSEEKVKCPLCQCDFLASNVKRHIYRRHVKCQICNVEVTRISLPKHIFTVHDKNYKVVCHRCSPWRYVPFSEFKDHSKRHNNKNMELTLVLDEGNKKLLCDYCEEAHQCDSCILYENLVLVGIKPRKLRSLQCKEKPLYYNTLEELKCHIYMAHPLECSNFECEELEELEPETFRKCGKIFPTEMLMKKHKIVHMRKSHLCWGCRKTFPTIDCLDWHQRQPLPHSITCIMAGEDRLKPTINEGVAELLQECGYESETESDVETKLMFNIDTFDNEDDKNYWKMKYLEVIENTCSKCKTIGKCQQRNKCRGEGVTHTCTNKCL